MLKIQHIIFSKSAMVTACIAWMSIFVLPIFSKASAQITNPSIDPEFGTNVGGAASTGTAFVTYFIYIWNTLMVVGGLIVLLFFIQAAIEWITAGGDSGKIQKARDRMIQSTIGLIILVFSFVIVSFVSNLLFAGVGFNILNLQLKDIGKVGG